MTKVTSIVTAEEATNPKNAYSVFLDASTPYPAPSSTPSPWTVLMCNGDTIHMAYTPSNEASSTAIQGLRNAAVTGFLRESSARSSFCVEISSEYSSLPVIRTKNGELVMMYRFVEELDGVCDYDHLQSVMPELTLGQIGGAIEFLMQVMQFNTSGVDIDDLESAETEKDPAFQRTVKESMSLDPKHVRYLP